ncbi:hypothetical protein OHA79_09450 [Streptomyces sp. NBC_00841]|uniref:hypothetical protein n=1 Tax=Streptomyces sp. NBC_00841 TaxID=2975847 RepID=UPI002DD7F53F|nr:hypothetical protein [Streptomyces sp. NBC_00841]WRZ98039.1 hypothetical protein OHA79_09450 [Streptomyces sp. NBC_00841]
MSYIDALDQLRTAGDELGYDDGWAEALLRRHARELAEQMRQEAPKFPQKSQSLAVRIVANRIDPEVA